MMNWTHSNGTVITELPDDCFGFVYKINYSDGMCYYGKKQIRSKQLVPLRKDGVRRNDLPLVSKRIKLTVAERQQQPVNSKRVSKIVQFETIYNISSRWKKYTGSSEAVPSDDKITSKVILFLSSSKTTLTYLENYVLYSNHAAADKKCYNSNISGRIFDNCLDGWIKF